MAVLANLRQPSGCLIPVLSALHGKYVEMAGGLFARRRRECLICPAEMLLHSRPDGRNSLTSGLYRLGGGGPRRGGRPGGVPDTEPPIL